MPRKQHPQWERVLEYMQEHGSISQKEADTLSVKRLSSRIYDLKKMDIPVVSTMENGKNIYGPYRYSRYSLEG